MQTIALYAMPVIFAITLHEAAHGYVARHFGDMTAYDAGPRQAEPDEAHRSGRHDRCVPLAIAAAFRRRRFLFGWAKPVPVNFGNLRHPKRDMLWVAAAGPAAIS